MNPDRFARIAESLRQYRRAELKDFEEDIVGSPIDQLYVDPLESNAILKTVLSSNTTFLLGRKGTGKSTIFAKAQSDIRKGKDIISVYVDIKSLYELISSSETPITSHNDINISLEVYKAHLLRKSFLCNVLSDLIREVGDACKYLSLWDRWGGKKRDYEELMESLLSLSSEVRSARLTEEEIPILQLITKRSKERQQHKESSKDTVKSTVKASPIDPSISLHMGIEDFDQTLADNELYSEYSDAVLRSFPFVSILDAIKDLLSEAGLKRLVVFFDDFSEIEWVNQKLFVDVILSPLNNASQERVKLKIAGYPGRVYYGKIDPSKVDTISIDFSVLYKAQEIQVAEATAINYTERLLEKRFSAFGEKLSNYFDAKNTPMDEFLVLIFQSTFNVPRLMGYILHYCYIDKISKGLPITLGAIRLASQKYYETIITQYFNRMARFALEPFERKLDRHNQHQLLKLLISEAKDVRRRIVTKEIGGTYFEGLINPPVSHFAISPALEKVLSSLELNFLLTKYHEMRDKDGNDVSIYAFFYGLCEAERFPWGYPRGRREDRSYFVQRCFNYNQAIHQFLEKSQTIRCSECGACYPIDKIEFFEFYNWKCPECERMACSIINLGDDFKDEVENLNKEIMLKSVELEILHILYEDKTWKRAGEISALIDVTYQLVGRRTTKLQETGLVVKSEVEGHMKSKITAKAVELYFNT